MDGMKFTIVGAGSSYTPELLDEMAMRKQQLPVREVMLYDIDEKRLGIMEGFCKRFSQKLGLDVEIKSTTDLDKALYGADFVDTQIRVGGNKQRVKDEKIPLQYDLVGQETTGAGGMMKAFRTIPVMLNVAGDRSCDALHESQYCRFLLRRNFPQDVGKACYGNSL